MIALVLAVTLLVASPVLAQSDAGDLQLPSLESSAPTFADQFFLSHRTDPRTKEKSRPS